MLQHQRYGEDPSCQYAESCSFAELDFSFLLCYKGDRNCLGCGCRPSCKDKYPTLLGAMRLLPFASADANADLPRCMTSRTLSIAPTGRHHTAGTHGKRPWRQRWRRPPPCLCISAFGFLPLGFPALASAYATGPRDRQDGNSQPDGHAVHHKTPVLPGFPGCLTTLPSA